MELWRVANHCCAARDTAGSAAAPLFTVLRIPYSVRSFGFWAITWCYWNVVSVAVFYCLLHIL